MARDPRLWVYKNRSSVEAHQTAYGNWADFFTEYATARTPTEWGGSWASAKDSQKRIFLEELRPGDLILCWQTDRSAALGLARIARIDSLRSGENALFLEAVEHFSHPAKLHEMKRTTHPELRNVYALKPGPVDTIYPTDRTEARLLLEAAGSPSAKIFR